MLVNFQWALYNKYNVLLLSLHRKGGTDMEQYEYYDSVSRVANASSRMLDVVTQEGIQPLVQAAAEIFGAPVMLTDQLFHIRAVWPKEHTGIPVLEDYLSSGSIKAENEWLILDENLSGNAPFYKPFYTNIGRCRDIPRFYGELVWENEVRGHVIVFMDRVPFRPDDVEIMEKLLSLLVLKIRKNFTGLDSWTATLKARFELMLDPDTPQHLKQPAIELLQKEIKGGYGIMVTPIGRRASQRAFADYAVMQIQQRFRNIVVLVYDQAIVILFGEVRLNAVDSELRPENNQLVAWLLRHFRQYDMVSGLSDSFEEIGDLYVHYRRALLTARMVDRLSSSNYALYNDYMPMPMLAAVLENETANTFLHPVLRKLQDYDRENGTSLFHSLYVYASHLFDRDEAAAELDVHKNTLNYRLNRIAELFGLDFGDRKTRLNLILSCYLWSLSENQESK